MSFPSIPDGPASSRPVQEAIKVLALALADAVPPASVAFDVSAETLDEFGQADLVHGLGTPAPLIAIWAYSSLVVPGFPATVGDASTVDVHVSSADENTVHVSFAFTGDATADSVAHRFVFGFAPEPV